jgi:hypothetical protein
LTFRETQIQAKNTSTFRETQIKAKNTSTFRETQIQAKKKLKSEIRMPPLFL